MLLFRQPVAGDWDAVFSRITGALTGPRRQQLLDERQARLAALLVPIVVIGLA